MANFFGTKSNDIINGTSDADLIRGGLGGDTLRGMGGNDQIFGEDGNDRLEGGDGDDLLDGGKGEDVLLGNDGDDQLLGGVGEDQLDGGTGRDHLRGGVGNDRIEGGAGTDAAYFSGNLNDYSITTVDGVTTVRDLKPKTDGDDGTDVLTGVERLIFKNGTVYYLTPNQAPAAVGDGFNVAEDGTAAGNLLTNDSDPDMDPLVVSAVNGSAAAVGSTITLLSGAKLTLNADGGYTYDSNGAFEGLDDGETGSDNFQYTVSDGFGGTSTATVTVTVNGSNDAPVTGGDTSASGSEDDSSIGGSVPAATDVDGEDLTYSLVAGSVLVDGFAAPDGTVTVNGDGTYSYTPNDQDLDDDETRTITFDYVANDGTANSAAATVTITVDGSNDAPVTGGAASASGGEDDSSIDGTVPAASDVDVEDLAYSLVGGSVMIDGVGAADGTVTVNTDGSYSYTPDDQDLDDTEIREITFQYVANDGTADSAAATVKIIVNGSNDAPVGSDDSYSTDEDTPLVVPASGVLANDTDVEGDALSAVLVSGPSNGALTLNLDGSFTYTPNANYNGPDSFTYTPNDGTTDGDAVTVNLTVNAVNDAPTLGADPLVNVAVIGTNSSDVSGAVAQLNDDTHFDFDATGFTVSSFTTQGEWDAVLSGYDVVVIGASGLTGDGAQSAIVYASVAEFAENGGGVVSTGWLLYTMAFMDTQTRSFVDYVSPLQSVSYSWAFEPYTISISGTGHDVVSGISSITSGANHWELTSSVDLTAEVLGTSSSINGDTRIAIAVDTLASGARTAYLGGLYLASAGYDLGPIRTGAADQLFEQAIAWAARSSSGIVDQAATEDSAFSYALPAGTFIDADGDPLTLTATLADGTALPTWLEFDASTGTFSGTPANGDVGSIEVRVTATDPAGASVSDNFFVTVENTNDAPVATDDSGSASEAGIGAGANASGDVLANDSDVDSGDTRTVSALRTGTESGTGAAGVVGVALAGQYGTLTLNADGSYSYIVDDTNPVVNALNGSQTLTDEFTYTVADNDSATDTATLTITIGGANDTPTATDDSGSATEAGTTAGANASGDVLQNDTDPDNGDTLSVAGVRTGAESGPGIAGTVGVALAGQYGSLTLNADGSYGYVVDDSNSTVNALGDGQTLTDEFTYAVSDGNGGTDTATLTITINGSDDGPVRVPGGHVLLVGGEIGADDEARIEALGFTADRISFSALDSTDLSAYTDIWIAWDPDGLAGDTITNASGTLDDRLLEFFNGGGNVFMETYGHSLSFLPISGVTKNDNHHVNAVTIVDSSSWVVEGLTNADLSNWGNSIHGYFTGTGSFDVIANGPSGPVIIGTSIGDGNLVLSTLDVSFHSTFGAGPPEPKIELIENTFTLPPDYFF